jgi:hypothetical protein
MTPLLTPLLDPLLTPVWQSCAFRQQGGLSRRRCHQWYPGRQLLTLGQSHPNNGYVSQLRSIPPSFINLPPSISQSTAPAVRYRRLNNADNELLFKLMLRYKEE